MAFENLDVSEDTRECIDACLECVQACEWCIDQCCTDTEVGEQIRLCRDTADIASLCARLCARESRYSSSVAETCAIACEECADVCEQSEAEYCQVCADVCRTCADACRSMA